MVHIPLSWLEGAERLLASVGMDPRPSGKGLCAAGCPWEQTCSRWDVLASPPLRRKSSVSHRLGMPGAHAGANLGHLGQLRNWLRQRACSYSLSLRPQSRRVASATHRTRGGGGQGVGVYLWDVTSPRGGPDMLMSWLFKVDFALVAYGKCFSVVVLAEI